MELRLRQPVDLGNARAELVEASVLRVEGALTQDVARHELGGVLDAVHARVIARKLAELTLDVRGLSYASSSAIRVFIDAASRAGRSGYRLILEIDRSITWHRINFSVLRTMAPQAVELRDVRHAAVAE